jgi:hypothetical protein
MKQLLNFFCYRKQKTDDFNRNHRFYLLIFDNQLFSVAVIRL